MNRRTNIIQPKTFTIIDAFGIFVNEKLAEGCSKSTVQAYSFHMNSSGHYVNLNMPIETLTTDRLKKMVLQMRQSNLSPNSIRSYTATWSTFLGWARREGLTLAQIQLFKGRETAVGYYSKDDVAKLLKKPNLKKVDFAEYRNWVMVNLFINNGCRSSTVRNIRIEDVHLDDSLIVMRHNKSRKVIGIPLSPYLKQLLKTYMFTVLNKSEWLFPTETGHQMSPGALASAFKRYNKKRGVEQTSVHMFRHTFARMYLVDCGGNALKLRRLLGHETLDMTNRYVRLFDDDLVQDMGKISPLSVVLKNKSKIRVKITEQK